MILKSIHVYPVKSLGGVDLAEGRWSRGDCAATGAGSS